jgi:predicted nuclease with TOPRIM domain
MLSDLEDEMNELEHNSDEYNELEEKLQEVQSNIDTAQEELDTIEPDTEPTEEMIDRQVENMLDDVKYDYKAKLDEFGMDISDWIDKDALAQAWVDADGYAIMNPYDESYDTVYIDETQYIVMRVN